VDGIIPPDESQKKLEKTKLDLLILEGTVDELILPEGVQWYNFSITEAVAFWNTLHIPKCILTHASFHSWNINKLIAGITHQERRSLEKKNPGLLFAYDGLKMEV